LVWQVVASIAAKEHQTAKGGGMFLEEVKTLMGQPIIWMAITLVIALIGATHYFVTRHNLWLGIGEREQKIIGRYVCGTLSSGIPFSFLCWEYRQWWALGMYWLLAAAAGIATIIFYRLDKALDDAKEVRAQRKDKQAKATTLGIGDGK